MLFSSNCIDSAASVLLAASWMLSIDIFGPWDDVPSSDITSTAARAAPTSTTMAATGRTIRFTMPETVVGSRAVPWSVSRARSAQTPAGRRIAPPVSTGGGSRGARGAGRAALCHDDGRGADHGTDQERGEAERGTQRDDRDRELHDDHGLPDRLAEGVEPAVQRAQRHR